MTRLQQQIETVRRRQQRQWQWRCISAGLLVSGTIACLIGVAGLLSSEGVARIWIATAVAAGPLMGLIYASVSARSTRHAAAAIDRVGGLKDRTKTALQFDGVTKSESASALQRLQLADADEHVSRMKAEQVAPLARPSSWPIAIAISIAAIVLAIFAGPKTKLTAAEVRNDVVSQQALRVEHDLDDLKELQEKSDDPELKELVSDLEALIEQLKEPGLDPKEALATLSEMEASLQEMQQQLDDPQVAAELQQVGSALALSEAMAKAGQSLAKGEMEKAAEELEKLEMPDLDRKTEKAITEKLDKLQQAAGDGNQKKSVAEAASKISQGLGEGKRGKFSDGMKGLAGEARKQARRKLLSDILKKQCKCLSECKSECESECRSQSESNKKGGSKAGSGKSNNEPGLKTAQLKTNPQMNLKGQESLQGDVDVETESSDPNQQQAVRTYREKADEYEALSESVLDSESIPLGHRQTIRKYFEMIRPTGAEVDAVNESMQ
ncbi:hypothetical protein [Allorhodopirellula heiligendammensis]|uniref:Chromosome partition protein Smc n=1 Tax=Allorhodopirellula heiligendammensis TaxID=2714739 RepID=A0A5C6C7X6_9BACT|nr:hypothetical protein [Allorhodopirellula heiligendammensis]TWU19526.1 hypothetical protein Poly21_16990 [Allorhodopirellula heiligendammensis]